MPTAAFITFGCKINQYETEAIREEVLSLGYTEVPSSCAADLTVVNTCTVTAESGALGQRAVRRAARSRPAGRIVVVGCSSAAEKEALRAIPQVALVAGNPEKELVGDFLRGAWRPGEAPPSGDPDIFRLRISRQANRTRAYVKVQDGCDSFCSFCVIPFLRGRSRSRQAAEAVAEVERLVGAGFREVVVTGVELQDYGADLAPPASLAGLIERLCAVRGLLRLRLSSINPRAFTQELVDALSDPVVCPHFHIPLQAGSDATLRRMRRDYGVSDYLARIARLRGAARDPAFTTDVIVGHPGETEADFEGTLAVCREVGFSRIHVFPYSRREGTLAAKLGGDLPAGVVRERVGRLRALEATLASRHRQGLVGRVLDDVLVEGHAARRDPGAILAAGATAGELPGSAASSREARAGAASGGGGSVRPLEGYTARYERIRFSAPSPGAALRFRGTLQPVRIVAAAPDGLVGEWAGHVRLRGRGAEGADHG